MGMDEYTHYDYFLLSFGFRRLVKLSCKDTTLIHVLKMVIFVYEVHTWFHLDFKSQLLITRDVFEPSSVLTPLP